MISGVSSSEGVVAAAQPVGVQRPAGGAFSEVMRRAERGSSRELSPEQREQAWQKRVAREREKRMDPEVFERAQEGAEQLVATTFIVPILQQLRESSTAEAPFGPGMYEKRMGPMIDAQIADRIVSAQRLPIVDAVRDRMLAALGNKKQTAEPASAGVDQGAGS